MPTPAALTIVSAERKTAVLTPSGLACLARVPTVNLTAGCAHGCLYCYTRGYSGYPGEGRVILYADTLDRLRDELARRRRLPKVVYFSPSSDLFQPVPQVLDLAYRALGLLFERGIGVALLTKGRIPTRHMALLEANASRVRAQIGLNTLDHRLAGLFEPHAASPTGRLAQLRAMAKAGIMAEARLDPILPGLTDDADTFETLCAAVAQTGVRQVAASMLFLRPAIVHALQRHVADPAMRESLLAPFRTGRKMTIRARNSSVLAVPRADRQRLYARLIAIARSHGLAVRVCACKNADLDLGTCGIAGDGARPQPESAQPSLFAGLSGGRA